MSPTVGAKKRTKKCAALVENAAHGGAQARERRRDAMARGLALAMRARGGEGGDGGDVARRARGAGETVAGRARDDVRGEAVDARAVATARARDGSIDEYRARDARGV